MIKIENYPNAYKEVYEILKFIPIEDLKKIPKNFIQMIEKNMNKEYEFYLRGDFIEEQELMSETRVILGYIFLNYWASHEQVETINKKLKQDIIQEENAKKEKYEVDVFKNKRKVKQNEKEQLEMVVYKKESFITKIFNKIRELLSK